MGTMARKIKILLAENGINQQELASRLGVTAANISQKLKRDNFSEIELQKIAEVCNATFKATFVMNDTGKEI